MSNFYLEYQNTEIAHYQLEVYDGQGKKVQQAVLPVGKQKLDLSQQSAGTYFLILRKEGIVLASSKCVKQ